MPFAVKVHPDVARMKAGDEGTRRRGGLVFSRHPTILKALPPEVKADPMLIVEKVTAAKAAPKAKASEE